MSTEYNFDAIPAAEQALEEMREVVKRLRNLAEKSREAAKATGAQQLIKDTEVSADNLVALADMLDSAIGEDGDNISGDGTFAGILASAKKLDAIANGK